MSDPGLFFSIYINDLLAEVEDDTFESAYVDALLMDISASNKDMIVESIQPEVDNVDAWSN